MMKQKAIIFDFGNVLGIFDHMKACKRLAVYAKVATAEDIYTFAMAGVCHTNREIGKMSPKEFFVVASKRFQFDTRFSFEEFCDIWGDIFSPENNGIERLLETLVSKNMPIFVLSNTEELHWLYIGRLPVMQKYFSQPERQILSFQVGARKPDVTIFKAALERSGLRARDIVYLDDVSEYVDTFHGMGGQGINYNYRVDSIEKLGLLL
jgi:putative hydrolase of the HAD superfamily